MLARAPLSVLLLALLTTSALPQDETAASDPAPSARTIPILPHAELMEATTKLAQAYPKLVQRIRLGHSRGGREIEALRLAGGEITPGRPAILLVANIDGPLVYTSGIALDHARALLAGYGEDAEITKLLNGTTLYIVPRANPDGAEARFVEPLRELRATGHGVDQDRDARNGEDDSSDIDGNGIVEMMRVPDSEGLWVADEGDERANAKADTKQGKRGTWKLVPEGLDDDGDEEIAEDPLHDAEVNRNFGAAWEEHTARAGLFPTHEPEVLALCDFVLDHRDIQLVLTYGELDNLVGKVQAVADDASPTFRVPPKGVMQTDADLLEELGRRFKELEPKDNAKGSDDFDGTFQAWCYAHRGLLGIEQELWSLPLEVEKEKADADADEADTEQDEESDEASSEPTSDPTTGELEKKGDKKKSELSDAAKQLTWIDANAAADAQAFPAGRHLGWRPFQHPTLGPVEIGGFAPYATTEPPAAIRLAIADRQLTFLTSLGELLARVKLVEVEAIELGSGLVEVTAVLENDSLLPLTTKAGLRSRTARPAKVLLRLPGDATLLVGSSQVLVSDLPGTGGRRELRWLIKGAPVSSIGISVTTDNAGSAHATPEVK